MTLPDSLSPRQKQVLTALVDHYIVRAEPVSSKVLSQSSILSASSATIRNTLGTLEDMGFVEQPHTSAGRLPTDLGYRAYVDELMHPEPLSPDDRAALDRALEHEESLEARLARVAQVLADRTYLLALVVPPPPQTVFRRLSLIRVEEGKTAMVLATSDQEVRSSWISNGEGGIETPENPVFRLETMVDQLNAQMAGRPVSFLNETFSKLKEVMGLKTGLKNEKKELDLLDRSILKLSQEKHADDVFIAGAKNLVNRPDFAKIEDISSIFELLESKVTLVHFLRQKQDSTGVHVTVGEERREDGHLFRSLSLITAAYTLIEGGPRGMVGVLGPKRIPYARLVPVVSHAARALSRSGRKEEKENTEA
ncbi:MAG: heat-inducible transcriptional repressor HrcA [Fibrobacteria bacterium]|jgi:heat-inducible transcriptional repressor|nr:heat-inducible transcriptional repressor HrcA [Fibrobacteria bacterium]